MSVTTSHDDSRVTVVASRLLLVLALAIGSVGIGLSVWARTPLDMGRLALSSSFNEVGIPALTIAVGGYLVMTIMRSRKGT